MSFRPYQIAWIICTVIAVAFFVFTLIVPRTVSPPADKAPPMPIAGADTFGGSFTMTDHNGNTVTDRSWGDDYLLVYFGFTFCPDVCPLGMGTIAQALEKIPADTQKKIRPIFVTVDPARDTADVLKNYVTLFNPEFIGLTGTTEQVDHIKRLYKVYAEKDGDDADYMVNHSAFTYLVDPQGTLVTLFPHETTPKIMAEKLKETIR